MMKGAQMLKGEFHRKRIQSHDHLCTFLFAGNAIFTVKSLRTEIRFTYRVSQSRHATNTPVGWFVSVLTGNDNERDYSYLGHIFKKDKNYVHGRKSTIPLSAPSSAAWEWFYHAVIQDVNMREDKCEIWHEGKCGKCGRKLTVPESIASGIGPECAKMFPKFYNKQPELSL